MKNKPFDLRFLLCTGIQVSDSDCLATMELKKAITNIPERAFNLDEWAHGSPALLDIIRNVRPSHCTNIMQRIIFRDVKSFYKLIGGNTRDFSLPNFCNYSKPRNQHKFLVELFNLATRNL